MVSRGARDSNAGASRGSWIAGIVAGAVAGAALGLASPREPARPQPVTFDHRLHVRDVQLECATCHPFEAPAPFSGLPDVATCATCHAEPLGTSAEEAKVVEAVRHGSGLAWSPLFREPRHVFFSHRLHAGTARIACERCHGAIADAREPPAHVRPLRMSECLECHRNAGGPTRCTACHR
jgi:hypothetical protein